MLKRLKRRLHEPAGNLHVCGFICLAAGVLMLVEVFAIEPKGLFLAVAVVTGLCALSLVYAGLKGEFYLLDLRLARMGFDAVFPVRANNPSRPSTLSILLYGAGILGAFGGYCFLALADAGTISSEADLVDWGRLDKRPMVLGYLVVGAFIAFHWFMVGFFFGPASASRHGVETTTHWPARLVGGVVIALLAYCWIALPALRSVAPEAGDTLARFYDLHSHVHLGALEQIRLGAVPYLEAQTQYGLGNQLLMYFLVNLVHFSNHGFYAANILLNVICVVGFFVLLQQALGFRWALAGLIGWILLPSPYGVVNFTGWAIFTRWLVIPILALLLAHRLLAASPGKGMSVVACVVGIIWGIGGFLSQENFSGGFLVVVFSLALFGPASGMELRRLAQFAGVFLGCGVITFAGLISTFVGATHLFEAVALANAKSGLVMAGHSNSIWSDNLGLSLAFKVLNGRLYTTFDTYGELGYLLETYGLALLLVVVIGLLAGVLGRRWRSTNDRERMFLWKFGGVAVGAYVLHLFTLLRSDASHLAGPSFLLPLFLLMLPLFAWRFASSGSLRVGVLLVSVGFIAGSAIAEREEVGRKIDDLGNVLKDTATAFSIYRELRSFRGQPPDLAARYSPIARYQKAFRADKDFDEAQELFGLLHERLRGRPVELGFYRVDDLVADPDSFYFLGGFRSISGITSPKNSIWLKAEEAAWIRKLAGARAGCIFFEPDPKGKLFEAWMNSARPPAKIVLEPIVGRRPYGVLACKS